MMGHGALDLARDLDRPLDLVRKLTRDADLIWDLERARDRARDLAHDLARDLHVARANDDQALGRALTRARNHARHLAVDLDLIRGLAHDLDQPHDLDHALDLVHDLDHKLDRTYDRTRDLDHALDRVRVRDPNHAPSRVFDVDLQRARDHARALIGYLARALDNCLAASEVDAETAAVARAMPGRTVRNVVGLAVRLLPVAQRPRYREEFAEELIELPRSQRCGYALRVLFRTWELRSTLVEVAHASEGESVRRVER